jgi:hypothetical protein
MPKWNMVADVAAPITVTAVDLITYAKAPTWNEWLDYIMTALGYVGGAMGFGGGYVKNLGVASLPLTARHIYTRITTGHGGVSNPASRFAFHPAVGGPIRQTTVPEYAGLKVT